MKRMLLGGAALLVLSATGALAGPFADFENAYRGMYGSYRAALFKTNTGQQDASAAAINALDTALTGLAASWTATPPPQYEDDPKWPDTMAEAGKLVATAKGQVAAGNLPEAHETLEGVREVFSDLHVRNGIETFSDRMNAYHAEMETVLALDLSTLDEDAIGTLREHAAVLAYLAGDVLEHPPAEAADNAEYAKLSGGFEASVQAMVTAARSGSADQLRAAIGGLKAPYSMLFVKFG